MTYSRNIGHAHELEFSFKPEEYEGKDKEIRDWIASQIAPHIMAREIKNKDGSISSRNYRIAFIGTDKPQEGVTERPVNLVASWKVQP